MTAAPLPRQDDLIGGETSSRTRAEDAGWSRVDGELTWVADPARHGRWTHLLPPDAPRRWRDFSWLSARALLDTANDVVTKRIGDLADPRRQRWIAAQRAAGLDPDVVLDQPAADSFLIVGDPGEIDDSQFAVIPPLMRVHATKGSDFLVVLSDVIYPAGDVNDYGTGFYAAFAEYGRPIYALPGNHDWYDGLNGFMWNFCGAEALPPTEFRASSYTAGERAAQTLWRRASRPDRPQLLRRRSPDGAVWKPRQHGPYWAMDVGGRVRVIAIDTGITGGLDREQAAWLIRMARESPLPKVLLTGKPLWVDGHYHPGAIAWGGTEAAPAAIDGMNTVDDIVRRREHRFVAAIGGDVHNYQRLTVTIDDPPVGKAGPGTPRRIEYVVTGGGGAYLSETHKIRVAPDPLALPPDVRTPAEAQFRCYPTRADSMAYYTRWYGRRLAALLGIGVTSGILAAIALWLWGDAGQIGAREPVAVAAVGLTGVAALFAVGAACGHIARTLFARGSRMTAFVLLGLAAEAGAVLLTGAIAGPGDRSFVLRAMLIEAGALLFPVIVVLVLYYGFASRPRRQLGAAILVTCALGLWLADFGSATAVIATVAVGLAVVALVLFALQRWAARVAPAPAMPTWISAPLTLIAYHAPVILALWRFDGPWALQVAVAGELGLIAVAALAMLVVLWVGAGDALLFMARGRLDPDDALAVLRADGIEETIRPEDRPGTPTRRARAIARYLRSEKWWVRIARSGLAQIGNADTPPMFKNFVHARLLDGGDTLELACYGVTGWKEHEVDVPCEDRVRVSLGS